jgi:hypothetical protein
MPCPNPVPGTHDVGKTATSTRAKTVQQTIKG